jgi:hypothetical protein
LLSTNIGMGHIVHIGKVRQVPATTYNKLKRIA